MRLGFFTMPMHPPHRNWIETLKEDRQSFILADKLGFYDAFCGEHIADTIENVTNSFQFLATLIPETKQIKLATGTANLSQTHPVLIAAHAAMFDHLAEGRFVLGDQRRCAAGGCRTARPPQRGSHAHLPRGGRRAVRAVDDGRALQFRSAQQPLQDFQRQDGPRRVRARHGRQAVSETLSRDRRHRGGAEFVERDVLRPQGHSSAVGELSAAAMAEIALGRLRRGRALGRHGRHSRRLAHRAHDLCGRRRQGGGALRGRGRRTARTGSTTSTCCASSASPSGSPASSTSPISRIMRSPTITWSIAW